MDFFKRYSNLNDSQRKAVNIIDGPVLVIAGPGTGKTELLGVRVANILQKTDTLPENILCLTFTDSGANAMRQRLTEIIGKEAYKVAIHTFHSFGTEIINQNSQYFYNGAHFKPTDNVVGYEIIRGIFEKLDYNNPLVSQMNDEYTHISDAVKVISEIKKSGLSSDELLNILDLNDEIIFNVEKLLSPIFSNRISKNTAIQAKEHLDEIRKLATNNNINSIQSLAILITDSLSTAIDEVIASGKTPSITKWRNDWMEKDKSNAFILKSKNRQIKLRALVQIYEKYLAKMEKAEVFDYDDMILQIIEAMERFDDLRFNLQEQYQYILVDEFQDTNMAQMRILKNLTNNEVQGDTPNIMVVGDDDQAIYSFQGADISNILDFKKLYPKAEQITLTENYRSVSRILESSRDVITQGENRLETSNLELNKQLSANNKDAGLMQIHSADNIADERNWIADEIIKTIKSGVRPNDIAVITRHHRDIVSLLPYLSAKGIVANYERQDNALEQEIIVFIEKLSRLLVNIANGRLDEANANIPEVLSHPSFDFKPADIWRLSTLAYDNHKRWLDIMPEMKEFSPFCSWLIETSLIVNNTTLEKILDIIIGNPAAVKDKDGKYVSPIYNYYFSVKRIEKSPNEYLTYLESLRSIRAKLREYHGESLLTLDSFINFIELCRKVGETISVKRQSTASERAINILTAHKAKGQEFDTVYIFNAVDSVWGSHSKGHNRLINYPENLKLSPAGETNDERLRLFYVAMTRAKNQLHISYSIQNDSDKETVIADFLFGNKNTLKIDHNSDKSEIQIAEIDWYQKNIDPIDENMRDLLLPRLNDYKLSVTHMQKFLDVKDGGPQAFLIESLLKFPQEKSLSAIFGTLIHDTIEFAHKEYVATKKQLSSEKIIKKFESFLNLQHLSGDDYQRLKQRGNDVISGFTKKMFEIFNDNQICELNFNNQNCFLTDAHISGKLDLVEMDNVSKTIKVTDYKTGKPCYGWKGQTEMEKIKLHHYKQQLMFYKLLIENSRSYSKYQVDTGIMQFVEPSTDGSILSIETGFDEKEVEMFKKLVIAVWRHITSFDLPNVQNYSPSLKGILQFESDLIEDKI